MPVRLEEGREETHSYSLTGHPGQTDHYLIAVRREDAGHCKTGICGTCAVKVLAGEPDHGETALSPAERDRAGLFCTCVSPTHGDRLVLDP